MPNKYIAPKRQHNQHRHVSVTFDFIFENPNPPHIWDACDRELEKIIKRSADKNMLNTMTMNNEEGIGFIQQDFIDFQAPCSVSVKSRECGVHGKSLSFFQRLRYLLTGRYWL